MINPVQDSCESLPGEEWRPVAGRKHLFVSSLGRLRIVEHLVNGVKRKLIRGRTFFPKPGANGYACYGEAKSSLNGVHHYVSAAFIGERPDGYHVDHINRNRSDNRVVNLRYVPPYLNALNTPRCGNIKRPRGKLFQASIKLNKSMLYLGKFNTREEALAAAHGAKKVYFWTHGHEYFGVKRKTR